MWIGFLRTVNVDDVFQARYSNKFVYFKMILTWVGSNPEITRIQKTKHLVGLASRYDCVAPLVFTVSKSTFLPWCFGEMSLYAIN